MTPAQPDPETQLKRDNDQINLLAIFHYLMAGFALIGIAFLAFHFFMMSTMLGNEEFLQIGNEAEASSAGREAVNEAKREVAKEMDDFLSVFRWFYVAMGVTFLAACVLNILSAVFMKQRRHRLFTMVVSGLNCLYVPIGTLLGVFTIMALMRPSIQSSYEATSEDG